MIQNHESYIEDVQQQLQKSCAVLHDLKKMGTQASSQEKQEDLYAPIMKPTKELEHEERISKNLGVIDPQHDFTICQILNYREIGN